MLRMIGTGLMALTLLSACGQSGSYQGMTNRQDVKDMGANHKITAQTENPRSINNVGYTWGLKQDRNMMKEAAESVDGVHVKRVIMEASTAWVTVKVDRNLSKAETTKVQNLIKKKVYNAVPRYNINVKVNQ
ncbi:hypothetical protein Q7A53_21200 [Halobacillus rhizosphaerae]|uniref:hypothetical protein n=1 Tax=Halobacillus rhizosphaerae TaxID=3064889 RepID=UPI00398B6AE8